MSWNSVQHKNIVMLTVYHVYRWSMRSHWNLSAEASLFNIQQLEVLPILPDALQRETLREAILSKVFRCVMQGWPEKVKPELQPYFVRRHELTVEWGCLLWGVKVIIPRKQQQQVLAELHVGHTGIVKIKSLARLHVWWPVIDKYQKYCSRLCPLSKQSKQTAKSDLTSMVMAKATLTKTAH